MTKTKMIFADCNNGNHAECLLRWPNQSGKMLTCECECHEIHPPVRYCVRCREPIDPKRVMRGSSFCSNECRKADLKDRRDYRASRACRLCGRPARHKTTEIAPSDVCDGSTEPEMVLQQEMAGV